MATLFLFGAGASRYSGECFPEPPPLGTELFDALVKRGGVAATIDADLAAVFRKDFERGTSLFRRQRGGDVTTLLREMAE